MSDDADDDEKLVTEGGDMVPFDEAECNALMDALAGGHPDGATEFQIREFLTWATKVRGDHLLLSLMLKGKLDISQVQHSVEETCNFHVSTRG